VTAPEEVRRMLAAGYAPRHDRLARQIARDLGVAGAPEPSIVRLAQLLAERDRVAEASAVLVLHADRVTTEPTTFAAERDLDLAPGEVCMSLRPFPSSNDSAEVVLYGSPEQLVDLFDSCGSFVEDVTP
jgi:hypothetical protein